MQVTGRLRAAFTSVALLAALGAFTVSTPGPAAAAGTPGGTWGPSQLVPGLAALVPAGSSLVSGSAGVSGLSCVSRGNCVLAGSLLASDSATGVSSRLLFIASEVNGMVGTPELVQVPASLGTGRGLIQQISCAAPGECTASGTWLDPQNLGHPFLVTEAGGTWGPATAVDTTALGAEQARITALSCLAPGDCTAVGYGAFPTGNIAFTLGEAGGAWGTPQALPATASVVGSFPESLSCASPGNCTAGGGYWGDAGPNTAQPFVATETGGTWGSLQAVPGIAALDAGKGAGATSVSCPDAADCTVVGTYPDASGALRAFAADETAGSWGTARELLLPDPIPTSYAPRVGCWSAGNCTATGAYMSSPYLGNAFIANEVNGTWGAGAPLANIPDTEGSFGRTVDCTVGGNCVVAGFYVAPLRGDQVFASTIANGSTGPAQDVLLATNAYETIALSCPEPGSCTIAGSSASTAPALANEASASTTTLQAATTSPVYGSEQSDTLTVTVTSPAGSTPTGTVTITTGTTRLCAMTLANGTATCSLTATELPASPFASTLTASYSGDVNYVGSTSAPVTLLVARAPTTTSVTVSPAALPYRSNHSFTFSVAVTSPFGTPAGWVNVFLTNGFLLCQAVLGSTPTCTSGTAVVYPSLNPGRYQVYASYLGDQTHQPSQSALTTLTITKASSTTSLALSLARVAYGQENLEKLAVKVSSPEGGTPGGTVTIKAGSTVICTIHLSGGKGSCTLSATRLRPGSYHLTASYGGSGYYAVSSATKTLTITS